MVTQMSSKRRSWTKGRKIRCLETGRMYATLKSLKSVPYRKKMRQEEQLYVTPEEIMRRTNLSITPEATKKRSAATKKYHEEHKEAVSLRVKNNYDAYPRMREIRRKDMIKNISKMRGHLTDPLNARKRFNSTPSGNVVHEECERIDPNAPAQSGVLVDD